MKFVLQVIKEQLMSLHLIFRLAGYEIKSTYQMHYLGIVWQFLNPAIQICAYWFVFGLGIRGGEPIGGDPFFVWLIVGIIPWFFISSSITQGSNSVYSKVGLVSKMNFPISVLPSITIAKNFYNFLMLSVVVAIILFGFHLNPGIYLIELPYYIFATVFFLFSLTILTSTISVLVRDFQTAINSVIRLLMFLTPIMWDSHKLSGSLYNILRLNPLFYLVDGFRNCLLRHKWFFEDPRLTLYFWCFTLLVLFTGAFMHLKFRDKFVDYL
ncbi:ABC transporter permease [Pullulanibacillus sp. KACC 23026]|uniref:ABC transporter permease n=1 Tax=Pullulanibacillus sp. KACC 23026 TaxID=3028315 RepID=UPI0023AEBE1E|nr:ABC transporter permease [Pullulanibacillus sp. KACC 23026]WEG13305.1 ABC transporter permease [Pullulanibacillus sp. KACC 23026]